MYKRRITEAVMTNLQSVGLGVWLSDRCGRAWIHPLLFSPPPKKKRGEDLSQQTETVTSSSSGGLDMNM
jgi:hypothetical protein